MKLLVRLDGKTHGSFFNDMNLKNIKVEAIHRKFIYRKNIKVQYDPGGNLHNY